MVDKVNVQYRASVPNNFSSDQRIILADLIINKIRENTQNGFDRNGKSFKGYSKSYKESLDFKNAGKTSEVDLTSTGDMLASIEMISHGAGYVTVGYPTGGEFAGQVEGNTIGSYGMDKGRASKARPFLGLPQNDLDLLIETVRNDNPNQELARSATSSIVEGLLRRFL